ncbi:MAG: phosphotransferase [Acidimicrobiales bacterium]
MALAPIPLIRTPEDISDAWLTKVFRASGDLDDTQSVIFSEKVSLGDAAGLLGVLYRVHPQYSDGAEGPTSVVIKFPTPDPTQRATADVLGFYKREVTFYNEHAHDLPFGVPHCYGAVQDTESTDFVLVMEDVAYLDQIDQVAGATLDQARTAVAQIAAFHAKWWESQTLDAMGEIYLPLLNPVYLVALPQIFEGGWGPAVEHEGHNITPEVKAFGDAWGSHVEFMLSALSTPRTIAHGDFRGDNLLFDEDNNLTILDFQIMGVGNGLFDVAYFMCQTVDTDVRHGHDDELIQLYVDTLAANGVEYSFDDAKTAYRIAAAFCLIYAVTSFAAYDAFEVRQHQLMSKMLSRSVRTIVDNDALALIP